MSSDDESMNGDRSLMVDEDNEDDLHTSNDAADDLEDEPPSFAAALGLHRVGSVLPPKPQPQQPIQVLNARGMPARIRKKNKLFFDDNIVNERPQRSSPGKRPMKPVASPPKTPAKILKKSKGVVSRYIKLKEESKRQQAEKEQQEAAREAAAAASNATSAAAPAVSIVADLDRRMFQRIGLRLRNLLKLPKAHKWVSYEWFYSYIDRPLFEGENDFQICLRESFPELKTRKLTRSEWSKIRQLMGKPRRCSQAFFQEERAELERRRQKIRLLQTLKHADATYVRDMPKEIPLALPIGTKVTARLRQPQDGIYTGTVAVVDSQTSTYRITFERVGLGTHSVPDFEVFANDFAETLPVLSLIQDLRPNPKNIYGGAANGNTNRRSLNGGGSAATAGGGRATLLSSSSSAASRGDPLLGSEIFNNSKLRALVPPSQDTIGGFPMKLLDLIVRTKKTLMCKQMKLLRLKNMNAEAEMCRSFEEPLPEDYQRRYAGIVIGMEKLNRDMQDYLNQIQNYTSVLTKEPLTTALLTPSYLRERCKELAVETVEKNNQTIKNPSLLRLITDLATIMWVASNMSANEQMSQVTKVLNVCMEESRNQLHEDNLETFQNNVQIHMRHIEMDLRQGSQATLANLLP